MMTLSRQLFSFLIACAAALMVVSTTGAQRANSSAQAAFLAYQCEFLPGTNSVAIHSVLIGADGLPMPSNTYTVGITPGGGSLPLPSGLITVTPIEQRPPVRIILVLDITDTVPLAEILTAINNHFLTKLENQDQVALLAFSQRIAPLTQFYNDKSRFAADQLDTLELAEDADNRLYDAVLQAVTDFPAGDTRKVVLVITDSRRRELQQASTDTIIQRARDSKTQIFTIGFHYEDYPDDAELINIASATQGYAWIYNGEQSRTAVAAGVGSHLDDFVKALNSEVTLTVDMRGQQPIRSPDGGQQAGAPPAGTPTEVQFAISVDPNNDPALTDSITCALQPLHYAIAFVNVQDNQIITNPLGIQVNVESELAPSETKIAFWLNDNAAQSGSADIYIFNPLLLPAGQYRLRAQLLDRTGAVLAATPILNLYAQQVLQLGTVGGKTADLSGTVSFQAVTSATVTLPDVQFTVSSSVDPNVIQNLGSAPFQNGGRAVLTIPDLQATIRGLFSDQSQNGFQVRAFVPGASAGHPPLAQSNLLTITLLAGTPLATATAAGAAPESPIPISLPSVVLPPGVNLPLIGAVVISLILLLINYSLMRQAYGLRINRLINSPDDYDLTEQLMTLTVQQDGIRKSHILTKKTMYIGRGSFNDINLGDDEKVSRQHGVVMWRRGQWYYANRKANVKTKINGKGYRGYALYKLEPVTELQIGEAFVYFHSNAQQDISELTQTNL